MAKTYTLPIATDTMSFHSGCIAKINIEMNLLNILILISSLSFMGYGIAYFKSTKMKSEFKRFRLEKAGVIVDLS